MSAFFLYRFQKKAEPVPAFEQLYGELAEKAQALTGP